MTIKLDGNHKEKHTETVFHPLGAGLGPMFSIVGWLAGWLAGWLLAGWLAAGWLKH